MVNVDANIDYNMNNEAYLVFFCVKKNHFYYTYKCECALQNSPIFEMDDPSLNTNPPNYVYTI